MDSILDQAKGGNISMHAKILLRVCVCFLLCAAGLQSPAEAGETIRDDALGFTLMLPDGFVACPSPFDARVEVAHCFSLGEPKDDQVGILLAIQPMRGVIGHERLKQSDMPPGFKGRLITANWKGFEIDGFEIPEGIGDLKTITYNVQVR